MISRLGTGRARGSRRRVMAEIKENFRLTYKHLRCKPEDRMRKRGTYGLINAINTRKIGGFLLFCVVYIYTQWVKILLRPGSWSAAPAARQTPETPDMDHSMT